jgi:hypothetical protein
LAAVRATSQAGVSWTDPNDADNLAANPEDAETLERVRANIACVAGGDAIGWGAGCVPLLACAAVLQVDGDCATDTATSTLLGKPAVAPDQRHAGQSKETSMRLLITTCILLLAAAVQAAEPAADVRGPKDEADLRYWLQNMIWHHRFSTDEITAATGLSSGEIAAAQRKFNVSAETKPRRADDAPLLVLPYPGGRHPRIGFLDGAIRPQRETKISVFTPWDDG